MGVSKDLLDPDLETADSRQTDQPAPTLARACFQTRRMSESEVVLPRRRALSADERWAFAQRLFSLAIWRGESSMMRDASCSLFAKLKLHVQVFMSELAGKCNERVRAIVAEPCGTCLSRFVFVPGKGILPEAPHALCAKGFDSLVELLDSIQYIPASGMDHAILRQDDPCVRAINLSPDDLLELAMVTGRH